MLMGISVGLAAVSAFLAYHLYVQAPEKAKKLAESMKALHKLIYNKYFIDELYFGAIINPLVKLSKQIWYYVDVNFIDKATYVAADLVRGSGSMVRSLQNGNIQQYALYISLGLVLTLSFILMR